MARLSALGVALLEQNNVGVDPHATELHRALARAVGPFSAAARHGALPIALRQRLMRASSQVASKRASFTRATAALDRAIDVLLPREQASTYSARGVGERTPRSDSLLA